MNSLPLLEILCNPSLKTKHFIQISRIVNFQISPDKDLTLKRLLELEAIKHLEPLKVILKEAQEEKLVEVRLEDKEDYWKKIQLKCDNNECLDLSNAETWQTILNQHLAQCLALQANSLIIYIQQRLADFIKQLQDLQILLD